MKLLIVEDEPDLLSSAMRHLAREGFRCEFAMSLAEARSKLLNFVYEALLVDLELPDGNGLDLVRMASKLDARPVIIITASRNALEDRLLGFESGADDFVPKPYHLAELHARLKAALRRQHFQGRNSMVFANLDLDIEGRSASVQGTGLTLTRKEFDLLLYLCRHRNKVVSRDSLAEHLWGDYMEDDASFELIYAHVKNLRKKLAHAGADLEIRNVYGMGYKLVET